MPRIIYTIYKYKKYKKYIQSQSKVKKKHKKSQHTPYFGKRGFSTSPTHMCLQVDTHTHIHRHMRICRLHCFKNVTGNRLIAYSATFKSLRWKINA